jgi:hypothetical protein
MGRAPALAVKPLIRARLWDSAVIARVGYPILLGLTIFAFALGSSSVATLKELGSNLRWAMLFLLAAVEGVAFLTDRTARLRLFVRPAHVLALLLVALALASYLWSESPSRSLPRAIAFALVIFVVAVGQYRRARTEEGRHSIVDGILLGWLAIFLGSVILVFFDRDAAIQDAFYGAPLRLQGLGENPNTVSLLIPIILPLYLWRVGTLRDRRLEFGGYALLALFVAFLFLSGARTPVGAAFIAVAAYCALGAGRIPNRAAAVAAAFVITIGGNWAAAQLPLAPGDTSAAPGEQQGPAQPAPEAAPSTGAAPAPRQGPPTPGREEDYLGQVTEPDTGSFISRPDTLASGSGRFPAWRELLELVPERPVLGYGFATEPQRITQIRTRNPLRIEVLADPSSYMAAEVADAKRALEINNFAAGHAENTYLGTLLNLGAVGLALLLGVLATVFVGALWSLRSLTRPSRQLQAALVGAAIGGAATALLQSYLTTAGNIATLTFWSVVFLSAAVSAFAPRRARSPEPEPRRSSAM